MHSAMVLAFLSFLVVDTIGVYRLMEGRERVESEKETNPILNQERRKNRLLQL